MRGKKKVAGTIPSHQPLGAPVDAVQRFFATAIYHFGFILPKSVLT
jgi:hypothetical protein